MWLYRHHTSDELIDLDHASGRWRPVDDSEKPSGARVLADFPTRGSYEIEDGKRYCKYWTDDNAFVFRTPDNQVFEICRKLKDGSIIESQPGLHAVIEDAKYADGRLRQGYSDLRLVDKDGKVLYELSYYSLFYLRLYSSDFTVASMIQGLSDWDFFVSLKKGIEIFAERAASGQIEMTYDHNGNVKVGALMIPKDALLFADTGEVCPRTGNWAHTYDIRRKEQVRQGQPMPSFNNEPACWVWLPEEIEGVGAVNAAAQSGGSSGLLSGETGEICPKEGVWGVVGDPWETATVRKGEPKDSAACMQKFLKSWYKAYRGQPWHDAHLRVGDIPEKPHWANYYGYWAFEAGALSYLYELDDSPWREHMLYPKDLVDWARGQGRPEKSQRVVPKREVLTAMPGEPCPESGERYSVNWEDRKAVLEKGKPMPGPQHSKTGVVIWHLKKDAQ